MKQFGGGRILQAMEMTEFFRFLGEELPPLLTPSQAFGAYVSRCGGDPEMTITHFTMVVPELCGPMARDHLALLGLESPRLSSS